MAWHCLVCHHGNPGGIAQFMPTLFDTSVLVLCVCCLWKFGSLCLIDFCIIHCCLVADMLTQYVEVEQLGQIYVCDACNGMSEVLIISQLLLPLYFMAFLGTLICLARS